MVREIKFRGKTDNGNWLFGEIISLNNHKYIAPNDGDWFDFIEWVPENVFHAPDSDKYEVEENTIGQFTGLHDKNGKEIYEGDIVKYVYSIPRLGKPSEERTDIGYVGFLQQEAGFVIVFKKRDQRLGSRSACEFCVEVIGNIYDNPELLKEE